MNKNNESPGSPDYAYKTVKSAAPLYAAAAVWVLWALLFPLYDWYHYLTVTGLSALASAIFSRIFPPKLVRVEAKRKPVSTGDDTLDAMLNGAREVLLSVRASALKIAPSEPELARRADALALDAEGIISYLAQNPKKAPLVSRFFTYYLPTLDKLLVTYVLYDTHGGGTDTSESSQAGIAEAVAAMENVFKKQHDKLLDDVTLDITSDIDVLETMLKKS